MSFVEGNLSLGIELAPGTLDRLKSQIAQLEKGAAVKLNIDPEPLNNTSRIMQNLDRNGQRAGGNITRHLGGALKAAGAAAGALGAIGAASLATVVVRAVQAGKEFNILQQQVRAGLTAVLGTTEAAEKLLATVNQLNDTSPFPRSAFLAATQQLVGFGVAADKVEGILDAVQQAVAGIGGDSQDIAMFTRAFAQIQSQGRLTGDVLFSLGSKGVDAAAIIGKQLGKTGQQIKDEVSKGTIGADQAIDLLTKGLREKFAGATDNVAKSFLGAKDRVTARLRDIGAAMTSAFIDPKGGGAAVDAMNNIAVALANIRDKVIKPMLPLFQQLGVFIVDLSKKFLDWTASLNIDSVMNLLNTLKSLAPVIALVGGNLAASLTQNIPVIGRLVSALGGPITAIAVLIATVPQLREAFMRIVDAMKPLAEALLPAFDSAIKIIQTTLVALAPVIGVVVTAIVGMANVLTPVIEVMNRLGLMGPIFASVAAGFALMKMGVLSFSTQAVQGFAQVKIAAIATAQQLKVAAAASTSMSGRMTALGTAGTGAMTAMKGVGTALAGLVTPANAALFVIGLIVAELAAAKAAAQEAADAIQGEVLSGLNLEIPEDAALGAVRINEELEKAQANVAKFKKYKPDLMDIFGANRMKNLGIAEAEVERLLKLDADIAASSQLRAQVVNKAMDSTKRPAADVEKVIGSLGITFQGLKPDQVERTAQRIIDALNQIPAEVDLGIIGKLNTALQPVVDSLEKIEQAQDKVRSSTRSLQDAQKSLADLQRVTAQELQDRVVKAQLSYEAAQIRAARAADRMTQAQISLTQAQRGLQQAIEGVGEAQKAVTDAQERLSELEKERARLLADVNHEARELARANAAIAASQKQLIDLGQQEEALLREREDLMDEGPDKILAADRSIERAKIALNNARREEIALQEELNRQNQVTLDLTGLSLDEIKSRLAGAKATLAAQKAVEKSKGKEEENADKLKTAELNRIDAEYALKAAIETRADVETDHAIAMRENGEALNQIQIDREEINRRIEEQHIDLNRLMEGETTKATTLKRLNEEIEDAVDGVKSAVDQVTVAQENVVLAQINVRDMQDNIRLEVINAKNEVINLRDEQRNVRDAAFDTKEHALALKRATEDVRIAQEQVRKDSQDAARAVADAKGDNEAINRLLWDRIGLNSTLLKQNPEIAKKLAEQIVAMLPAPQDESTSAHRDTGKILNDLINAIMNKPQDVIGMMKNLGIIPLAEGGIVRQHTVAQIGEYGKAEVVLPLTKPGRAMTLLAESIPLMHTSLQKKIAPLVAPQPTKSLSLPPAVSSAVSSLTRGSGKPVVRKADGPVTYGQMQELITLMNNLKSETHIEAPVTVTASYDEDELMRKLNKKIERHINYMLSKRR